MAHAPTPPSGPLRVHERPGQGPPIVLLHGILRSSTDWGLVADHLHAEGRAVLLVDDRGHGASPGPVHDWGPRAVAADTTRILDARAPRGAHLVGHSRGGTAASWIALERPDLARSLAVVCAPPEASEAFRAHFRHRAPAAEGARRAAFDALARIPDDEFPGILLRGWRGPTLIVEAEDDPLYSPTHTLFWRAHAPYATFARLPGDHDLVTTPEGAREVARLVLDLVARAEAA